MECCILNYLEVSTERTVAAIGYTVRIKDNSTKLV